MPQTISISPNSGARSVGLEVWMERVVERAQKVREDWDPDSVHDLRVALRRCRTMAEALNQVNPDSGWRKIKKSTKRLFHSLGELRDTQIEREWVKKIAPPKEPVRGHLLRALARREKSERTASRKALDDFALKEWKKLSRKLTDKAELFPLESIVFQRLALAKLRESTDLFASARKRRSAVAWHRARIGLKQFRYIMENFLPRKHAVWSADIKRLQDLLGEVHDLDVLRLDLRRQGKAVSPQLMAAWLAKIEEERKKRLVEVIAETSGNGSLLQDWRSGLEIAHTITPSTPLLDRRSA
jgi:CHAD domain-containing protein